MIDVALLGIIRRWHFLADVSLREISKRLSISRNIVRLSILTNAAARSHLEVCEFPL